jgi:hypothetical protein
MQPQNKQCLGRNAEFLEVSVIDFLGSVQGKCARKPTLQPVRIELSNPVLHRHDRPSLRHPIFCNRDERLISMFDKLRRGSPHGLPKHGLQGVQHATEY